MQLNDSQRSALAGELEQIAVEAYNMPREDLRATSFVPRQEGVNEWAETWVYPIFTKAGVAKFVSDYGEDLPPVNTFMEKKAVMIKTIADAYSYSEEEVMAWLNGVSGRNLSREGAEAARETIDEKVDRTILVGDALAAYTGLFNNGNVSLYTVAQGAGGSTAMASKTLDEIVADVKGLIGTVSANCAGPNGGAAIKADTVILPSSVYGALATKKIPDSGETALDYLKRVFLPLGVKNWFEHELLETAGVGGTTRMMAYKMDKKILSYVLPIPFKQKDAQEKALSYNIPCYARCGGVVFKRVKAFAYGDGV